MEQIRVGNTRRSNQQRRGAIPIVFPLMPPPVEDSLDHCHAGNMDLDQNMTDAGNYLEKEGHAKNTKKSYGPKEDEFKAYCLATSVSPSSRQFPHQIEAEKVFRFIVYQCTREKKRKGAKKKDSPNFGSLEPFDLKDYRAVMSRFQSENSFDPGTHDYIP
jgi:hypothetical protein